MATVFPRIALALTFSPYGKLLLEEAVRLKQLFGSELFLIHIGEDTAEEQARLDELIGGAALTRGDFTLIKEDGDPAKLLMRICEREKFDLLILGALEKEQAFKYYIGSVARKVMRKAPCNLFIRIFDREDEAPRRNVYAAIEYNPESEFILHTAAAFARFMNEERVFVLREYSAPGLAMTHNDNTHPEETELRVQEWQKEEEEKLELFLREFKVDNVATEAVCLYGREGFRLRNFVKERHGKLLIVNAPEIRLNIFDRLFQHDHEYLYNELPSSLLLIKKGYTGAAK